MRAEVVRVRGLSKAAARSPRLGVEPRTRHHHMQHDRHASARGGGGRTQTYTQVHTHPKRTDMCDGGYLSKGSILYNDFLSDLLGH